MATKDVESILDDILSFLQANLNTKITEVNTEKGDGIEMDTVGSTAYLMQTLNDTIANFDPFVFYGVVDSNSDGVGPATSKTYIFNVVIVKVDSGQSLNLDRVMLRYNRVFVELFEKNWDKISKSDKFEVQSLEPISFRLLNNSDDYRATGVELRLTIF